MSFYGVCKNIAWGLSKIIFRVEVKNADKIPNEGNLIICGNHISLLDPVIVATICPRQIKYMAKKELFNIFLLRKAFRWLGAFPVDRSKADISAVKNALKILKNKEVLGIFPEGTRVKSQDINNAKAGISMIAIKSKSPIVPVFIDTKYRLFGKIRVTVGDPIDFKEYYSKRLTNDEYKNLSIDVMDKLYSLKN
ncbi:lysophospholipid acyltransferase family protein [Clostridiaceae bacterium M8S5]|nr:lysophospholipid acyltransferase family protein [Clostridiaceae bacterium M8S5]